MKENRILIKNGEELFYRYGGNGNKNILLIHGNMCSSYHFEPIFKFLEKEFKIFAVDLRGFGNSSYNNKIYDIKNLSDDIKDFLYELGVKENLYIVGWSAGAPVAMEFVADNKKDFNIKKLILIEPVGDKGCPLKDENGEIYKDIKELKNNFMVKESLKIIEDKDFEKMRELWDRVIYINKKPEERLNKILVNESLKQRNLLEMFWLLCNFNISNSYNGYVYGNNKINNIDVQVDIFYGKDDKIISYEDIKDMKSRLKKCNLYEIEKCGHSPFIDCIDILGNKIVY